MADGVGEGKGGGGLSGLVSFDGGNPRNVTLHLLDV